MSERTYVLLGILCFIVGVLTLAYSTVSGTLAIEGIKLSEIEEQIKQWHIENLELRNEYLHKAAYTTIYQEAIKQGYTPAKEVILQ